MTIFTAHGLRFVIFLDDHEPAHVHVFGDEHLKVNLVGPDGATLVRADGMKRGDIRKAMAIVAERRDELLNSWKRIHG